MFEGMAAKEEDPRTSLHVEDVALPELAQPTPSHRAIVGWRVDTSGGACPAWPPAHPALGSGKVSTSAGSVSWSIGTS
jgi:hypothetical protein